MTIQAILWDLDGTLADSTALHYQAWQTTLRQHGEPFTYQEFIATYGRNNLDILGSRFRHRSRPQLSAIADEKESTFRGLLHPGVLQLLPGVLDWLTFFRSQGMVQVVGSSGPMANIAASVHALAIADYFLALVSGTHLPQGKPNPAIFLRCATVAGVAPAQCVVIEDSIHGVEAAQRAGMRSVAVGTLAQSEELDRLLAAPAALPCARVPNLAQLAAPDFWQSLQKPAAPSR